MTEIWGTFERVGTVVAIQLKKPLEWRTSEGAVLRGETGDWLITDPSGGQRTAKDANFHATHTWEQGDQWRRTSFVQARRARPGETVDTQEGPLTAKPSASWVVRDALGAVWIVPEDHFVRTYRRVTDPR